MTPITRELSCFVFKIGFQFLKTLTSHKIISAVTILLNRTIKFLKKCLNPWHLLSACTATLREISGICKVYLFCFLCFLSRNLEWTTAKTSWFLAPWELFCFFKKSVFNRQLLSCWKNKLLKWIIEFHNNLYVIATDINQWFASSLRTN